MNQLPFVRGRVFGQKSRYSPSPLGNCGPAPPLPPEGTVVSTDTGQKLLEDVFLEDQAVPAAGLSGEKQKDEDGGQRLKTDAAEAITLVSPSYSCDGI